MIKAQEWRDWLNSPVTKAVIEHFEEEVAKRTGVLLQLDCSEWSSLEEMAIKHVALRSELSGLGEFLDLDTLKESIEVNDEN